MAIIDSIRNKLGQIIYPKTLTKAVYEETTNKRLDNILKDKADKVQVSTDIATHNADIIAHGDIRQAIENNVTQINEIESKRLILSEDIGNKANLQTDDKTNLVGAVNEVKSQSNEIVMPSSSGSLPTVEMIDNYYDTVSKTMEDGSKYSRRVSHGVPHPILGGGAHLLDGYKIAASYETQVIYSNTQDANVQHSRSKSGGIWSKWKQIATTDKIDVLCTPLTGYKIDKQNNYRINNIVYFNLTISRTGGEPFGEYSACVTIPSGLNASGNRVPLASTGLNSSLVPRSGSHALLSSNTIYVSNTDMTITQLIISGTLNL